MEIRRLDSDSARAFVPGLAQVLYDCVKGGASVSFIEPFTLAMAEEFFRTVAASVERNERILLAAFDHDEPVGTVQVILATPPNQPHRGEIAKLLVLGKARGSGVAAALMGEAEKQARLAGKTLLNLDTVTGSIAERLYERLGWTKVGVIPQYALFPDGTLCATTIFFKLLN